MAALEVDSEESRRLVERVRAGDREALNALFSNHEEYLRCVVGMRLDRRLRARMGVSDVVQATHLDALTRIDEYLAGDALPFRWWLRKTAQGRLRRVYREHVKAGKRAIAREVPLSDRSSLQLAARFAAGRATPSQQVAKREQARRVRQALGQLAGTDREVLLLRNFEQMPYEEIAYVLGIAPAAARMRHGRALVRLGKLLREGGLTEGQV